VPPTAISSRWVDKRKPYWNRLEALLARAGRGVSGFTHDELRDFALLYRQTAADLAAAREHRADAQLAAYLNGLLGRAHNVIYAAAPRRPRSILAFYTRTFPQIFRATWRYTAAAAGIFLLGSLLGVAACLADPGFERFLLGGEMMDTIHRREMWTHSIIAVKPLASSAILTNNLSVSFAAFALGITAGVGTTWIMFFNGVLISVVAAACYRVGMATALWSFVAPHGSLELPAIFIAGGAGLLLGRGLIAPGTLPRREALRLHAAGAVRLVMGIVPLLVIAGVIEGFISPIAISPAVKFVIGGSLLVLLALYLLRAGTQAKTVPHSRIPNSQGAPGHTSPRSFVSR
jgi:uncharacterized membrane protein SpoIIM required for sporulation